MNNSERLIDERKEKILKFFKKEKVWIFGFLILAIILGVYIRSLPMQDHNSSLEGIQPGLWDIAKDDWTLGPDLDPWLFTRYAKTIVEQGSLSELDAMRNVPLGFETSKETMLLPYMISWTYSLVNLFGDYSVEFAAVLFPVIMFAFTIIAFFLFVREIFLYIGKRKAVIISLIATFFMIVVPEFLSRTVAGIPEKESAAFFFMFLSFYLFLKSWKSEKIKRGIILAVLAGISTAIMGLISGLVVYVFVTIAIATFIAFILEKTNKKEFIIYSVWVLSSLLTLVLFSGRFSLGGFIASLDTGLSVMVLVILCVHFALWSTKLSKNNLLNRIKLPKNIISLILAFIIVIILVSIIFGPSFIIEKIRALNQILFEPTPGRWNRTVAENRQPYFTEWGASFGPFIQNIPVMFWMFFLGSVVLFKKMLKRLKPREGWILTGLYIIFFFGLVFSRYAPNPSLFNGENFISKAVYFISALLLIGALIYFYAKYHKANEHKRFQDTEFSLLLLFSLFILCLFTARSAVRLIMVLAPIAPIFLGYLIIELGSSFFRLKEDTKRLIIGSLLVVTLILTGFMFWNYYQEIESRAYGFVPSSYNHQWQIAMEWVRENTAKDSVFAHWWDYGYWVQSIGERATVLDGGNAISFWNYYMGRLVLTGDNQKESLDFLYAHKANYLLIDSTDILKYGAFSSIGSNETFDRYSWIPVLTSDSSQLQETSMGQIRVYQAGYGLDEDISYNLEGEELFFPYEKSGIAGVILENYLAKDESFLNQPLAVLGFQGKQYKIPIRYVYFKGNFKDFGEGLEAAIVIIDSVSNSEKGMLVDSQGALIYLSPRVLRGFLAQKYLLDDPFNNFPNFNIIHTEQNLFVENLRNQGVNVGDFVYYQGIQGPIKIWKINYVGNEQVKEEYLDTDASKYLSWQL